jgi:hypothetical protein
VGAGQNGVGGFLRGFGSKLMDVYWEEGWLEKKKNDEERLGRIGR